MRRGEVRLASLELVTLGSTECVSFGDGWFLDAHSSVDRGYLLAIVVADAAEMCQNILVLLFLFGVVVCHEPESATHVADALHARLGDYAIASLHFLRLIVEVLLEGLVWEKLDSVLHCLVL